MQSFHLLQLTLPRPYKQVGRCFCASHQTFMQAYQADPKTFNEAMSEYIFFECDSYPMLADSVVSDIERTPCWSERLRRKQGRACRTDTHRSLMCTSCWDGSSTLETRRGYPSRSAEGGAYASRQWGVVCLARVIEWGKTCRSMSVWLLQAVVVVFSQRSLVKQWQTLWWCCVLWVDGAHLLTVGYGCDD